MSHDRAGDQAAEPAEESADERGGNDGWTLPYFVPFGWPSVFRSSDEDEPDPPGPDE